MSLFQTGWTATASAMTRQTCIPLENSIGRARDGCATALGRFGMIAGNRGGAGTPPSSVGALRNGFAAQGATTSKGPAIRSLGRHSTRCILA